MQVNFTNQYRAELKKLKHQRELLEKIEKTLDIFRDDPSHTSLNFKKITCKRDKRRHSIRIAGTQYRILMSRFDTYVELICICNHDKYDLHNKNC